MPVNITNEELDIFNKNGFTDDDVQATVNHYRSQGLDDNAIRAKIDSRLQGWSVPQNNAPQPLKVQTENEQPDYQADLQDAAREAAAQYGGIPANNGYGNFEQENPNPLNAKQLQGNVSHNVRQEWDAKGNIHYIDENGNEINNKLPFFERVGRGIKAKFTPRYKPIDEKTKDAWQIAKFLGGLATRSPQGFAAVEGFGSFVDDWIDGKKPNVGKAAITGAATYGGAKGLELAAKSPLGQKAIQKGSEFVSNNVAPAVKNAVTYIKKGLDAAKRKSAIAKRKQIPLYERVSEQGLKEMTTPASQYGVAEINSAKNEAIAKQIEGNIKAENDIFKEYQTLRSNAEQKYGNIQNLKEKAKAELERTAETGEVSEVLQDYQNLVEYEKIINNAKYVENTYDKTVSGLNTEYRRNKISDLLDKRKDWGIAYRNASGNPKLAIETLRKNQKGFVPDAFYREELGNIDLVWGEHNFKTQEGYGLHHLIERRKAHKVDIDKFLTDLPDTIQNGKITQDNRFPNRRYIEDAKNKISIALDWNGKDRKWVITAFTQNKSAGKRLAAYAPQMSKPFDSSRSNFTTKLSADDNIITNSAKDFKSAKLNQTQAGQALNSQAEYQVLHNEELAKQAAEIVNKEGAYSNLLTKASGKEKLSALDFESGRQMVDNLMKSGKTEDALNLIESLATKASEAGQAVQALSLWSRTTPDGAVLQAQKILEKYNNKTGKKLKLTPEQANTIKEMAENIHQAAEGRAKDLATAKLLKYQTELVPASFAQKAKTLRNISLLLNPKTLVRNVAGNGIFAAAEKVSQALATGIDKGVSFFTKKRTRVAPKLNEYFGGMKQGFKEGIEDVANGIDTRGGIGGRFDLPNRRSFEGGILGNLETGLDYGLRVPDRAFYQAAYNESIANQMAAQGLKEATPEILEQARKEALEAVFQNNSKISDMVLALRKGANKLGPENFGLGDLAIPYAQTPANLVQQGINYSPFGIIKAAISSIKDKSQRQATLDLGRALTGSGIMGAGYGLTKLGLANGEIKDRQERENLQAINERPFTVGGVSYNQLQPISQSFGAGVALANNESPLNASLNTLLEMPFMDNAKQFAKDTDDYGIGEAALRQLASYPTQFVPTALNQINTYADNSYRETYDPNFAMTAIKKGISKVPLASKMLPAKSDVRGKEVKKNLNPVDVFLNPVFVNKREDDPIMNEILRLKNDTGENTLLPLAKRKITGTDREGNKLDKKLSSKEYAEYKKKLGQEVYSMLDKQMATDEYQRANDEEKATIIKATIENAQSLLEGEMFNKRTSYDKVKRKTDKVKQAMRKQAKNFVIENY